jgi:hypothetical protein
MKRGIVQQQDILPTFSVRLGHNVSSFSSVTRVLNCFGELADSEQRNDSQNAVLVPTDSELC